MFCPTTLFMLSLVSILPGRPPLAHVRPTPGGSFGVVVMAHGGTAEWNAQVLTAVAPLRERYPTEVAFGMADPVTIQEAVTRLEAQGATRIGVVRLFISGESWRERTEQILGLRPGAPLRTGAADHADTTAAGHAGHRAELWRVASDARFVLSPAGLAEAEGMGEILADRARALSRDPAREQVLILAHGPGDDAENSRWMAWMDTRAEAVRRALPFRRVEVMTLREDWPEKRQAAIDGIRGSVAAALAEGITTVVIPFRVQGFGPYHQVLEGLAYVADGHALVPHTAVTSWLVEQATTLDRISRAAIP